MTINDLKNMDACQEAVDWCATQPDMETAWKNCDRGDWLLWLIRKTSKYGDKNYIAHVRIACRIARHVLQYIPAGEERPRLAIEAAEAWCNNPTSEAASRAASAASAASRAASLEKYADWVREVFPELPKELKHEKNIF